MRWGASCTMVTSAAHEVQRQERAAQCAAKDAVRRVGGRRHRCAGGRARRPKAPASAGDKTKTKPKCTALLPELAHVLVAKHSDHLPLYRQEAILGRVGLAIPRSTLAAWVGVCGVRLQPLVNALKRHVLASAVVHADETPGRCWHTGQGQDASRLSLGLCYQSVRALACGCLRLHAQPCQRARAERPRQLERQCGLRWIQRAVGARDY